MNSTPKLIQDLRAKFGETKLLYSSGVIRLIGEEFEEFPPELEMLSPDELRSVSLEETQVSSLPAWLSKFPLKFLSLRGNARIAQLPEVVFECGSLKKLMVYMQPTEAIPDEIGSLCNLEELYLMELPILGLPDSIGNLTKLREFLVFRNRQLRFLPELFSKMENLKRVSIATQKLEALPETLSCASNLTSLGASSNEITSIPDSFGDLKGLEQLGLGYNQIREIPRSLGKLVGLRVLSLGNNEISELPAELAHLERCEISLTSNRIRTIPREFGDSGVRLLLSDNPLHPDLDKAFRTGQAALNEYLSRQTENFEVPVQEVFVDKDSLPEPPASLDSVRIVHNGETLQWKFTEEAYPYPMESSSQPIPPVFFPADLKPFRLPINGIGNGKALSISDQLFKDCECLVTMKMDLATEEWVVDQVILHSAMQGRNIMFGKKPFQFFLYSMHIEFNRIEDQFVIKDSDLDFQSISTYSEYELFSNVPFEFDEHGVLSLAYRWRGGDALASGFWDLDPFFSACRLWLRYNNRRIHDTRRKPNSSDRMSFEFADFEESEYLCVREKLGFLPIGSDLDFHFDFERWELEIVGGSITIQVEDRVSREIVTQGKLTWDAEAGSFMASDSLAQYVLEERIDPFFPI